MPDTTLVENRAIDQPNSRQLLHNVHQTKMILKIDGHTETPAGGSR